MQNTIIEEFENHPGVVAAVFEEGGKNGETLDWARTFWASYYLRDFAIWDPDGSVGQHYRMPQTGLPFGRGFVIDQQGNVALPHFGHDPAGVIETIYELLGCTEPEVYCTAKITSLSTHPSIGWSGAGSVGQGDFEVNVSGMVPGKPAIAFWGAGPNALPFQGGWLCVLPPIQRGTPLQLDSGGFGRWMLDISGEVPGADEHFQCWGRDPADPASFGTSLSDALRVTWCD